MFCLTAAMLCMGEQRHAAGSTSCKPLLSRPAAQQTCCSGSCELPLSGSHLFKLNLNVKPLQREECVCVRASVHIWYLSAAIQQDRIYHLIIGPSHNGYLTSHCEQRLLIQLWQRVRCSCSQPLMLMSFLILLWRCVFFPWCCVLHSRLLNI